MKNSLLIYKLILFNIILIKTKLISCVHFELKHGKHTIRNSPQKKHIIFSCPNEINSSLHPFVDHCYKYFQCFNGELSEKTCPEGLAFDKNRLFCDHRYKTECNYWNRTENYTPHISRNNEGDILCPLYGNGPYSYPFDNKHYINCSPPNTIIQNCPYGQIFNTAQGKCLQVHRPPENSDNKDLYKYLFRCPRDERKNYLYPYTPRKYIQCNSGQLRVLDCGPQELFSSSQGNCLPETQVPYDDHVKEYNAKNPAKNNDIIECPIELFGIYPHPFNNQKYLKCVYGRLYEKPCGIDQIYNMFTKICEKNNTHTYEALPQIGNNFNYNSKVETRTKDGTTFLKCPPDIVGTFIHPFYCDKYINCSPAGTRISNCSEIYNFRKGACDIKTEQQNHVECIINNGNSEDTSALGVFCEENRNFPHPKNAYKFIRCSDGKPQIKWCLKHSIFDIDSLECIKESNEMDK